MNVERIDVNQKIGIRVLRDEIVKALNLRGRNLVGGTSLLGVVLRHRIWLLAGPGILAARRGCGLGVRARSAAKNKAQG